MQIVDIEGIPVHIEEARGRSGSIRCVPGERVVFRIPRFFSEAKAMQELMKRWPRIRRQFERLPPDLVMVPATFGDGEKIRVLDRTYTFDRQTETPLTPLIRGAYEPTLIGERLCFADASEAVRRKALRRWIAERTMEETTQLVRTIADQLGVSFDRIQVRTYRSRLGCCVNGRLLKFHWGITLLPRELFETVVAHEVVHLKHNGHRRDFWETLLAISPRAREHHRVLRVAGSKLTF